MLRALELVGFKSFADKTRFEFPQGITVIVGPNGSGKSNIVDAIKWVLGEQSVKSLRGKEMADCIFNGSATRRPLNSAETTLVFDNSQRQLAVDAPEVHVTRRVYRSGEGEYLINRQPCRLRDIRDLFAGTGVTTEAYSVIEQGKVDVLLQSSPRDRRLIFEEAAGISRFKLKKLEALRRLERVEQNLLRLSDIVDEVDSRLKTVRLQAAKARRYKECADRLQQLRTQVALVDYRQLSGRLAGLEQEIAALGDELGQFTAQAEAVEARALALDVEAADADRAIRSTESQAAQNRERIAALESLLDHERRRLRDLEEEAARQRRQGVAMTARAGDLQEYLEATSASIAQLDRAHRQTGLRLAEEERALTQLVAQLDEARRSADDSRQAHLDLLRAAAGLGNEISGLEAKSASTEAVCRRGRERAVELRAAAAQLDAELESWRARLERWAADAEEHHGQWRAAQTRIAERRRVLVRLQQELAALREKHSGGSERAAVLEELERRLEGLGAGVKELLVRARAGVDPALAGVRGVVADLLQVDVQWAGLIEAAVGEAAQHLVVVDSGPLLDELERWAIRLPGRVTLLRLDAPPLPTPTPDLAGYPGVVARADRCLAAPAGGGPGQDPLAGEGESDVAPPSAQRGDVRPPVSDQLLASLPQRLLGKTWIVERLADALALQAGPGAGCQFVTRGGEVLSADGSLSVGPRHASAGLISRRTELRALREQLAQLTAQIEAGTREAEQSDEQIGAEEQAAQQLAAEHQQLVAQLNEQRLAAGAAEERRQQLAQQLARLEAETRAALAEHEEAVAALAQSRSRLAATETQLRQRENQLAAAAQGLAELEQVRQRQVRETGAVKVELARAEQQLANLRGEKTRAERDRQERGRALAENRAQLLVSLEKVRQSERAILAAESDAALLYLRKESLAGEVQGHLRRRDTHHHQRGELNYESQRLRGRARKLETKIHARQLAAQEVGHERAALVERMQEDYGLDLASLESAAGPEELAERSAVEQEIADLRGKLNSIGGVNLDALEELEQLEARYESLSAQHGDLAGAKASLDQIIAKINLDSRRMFSDTVEVVREHFQGLFRKLFGGGQADIVLEEGADVLEGGVEIVARPPGKEPRSISLLSGGEKTLTCVALLLAIFRSRPSPFCVLDEVDAALDEANIERFVGVLKEFLAWTQFVVVTHSKKTMTAADTLYGVTMQESGISKRVAVRFEDVSDNGEILNVRDDESPTADETQAA